MNTCLELDESRQAVEWSGKDIRCAAAVAAAAAAASINVVVEKLDPK